MSDRAPEAKMFARMALKRRKGVPLVEYRALPTTERLRRAGRDIERGDTGQITMRDSPLERALARSVITQEQYLAGQKYRHNWYHAGLSDCLGSVDLTRVFAPVAGGFHHDGEDGGAGFPSSAISRSDTGGRQDRIVCTRLDNMSGGFARAGRLRVGVEQSTAGLCRGRGASEVGFGRGMQAMGHWQ